MFTLPDRFQTPWWMEPNQHTRPDTPQKHQLPRLMPSYPHHQLPIEREKGGGGGGREGGGEDEKSGLALCWERFCLKVIIRLAYRCGGNRRVRDGETEKDREGRAQRVRQRGKERETERDRESKRDRESTDECPHRIRAIILPQLSQSPRVAS